jgi:hypothetical protein
LLDRPLATTKGTRTAKKEPPFPGVKNESPEEILQPNKDAFPSEAPTKKASDNVYFAHFVPLILVA